MQKLIFRLLVFLLTVSFSGCSLNGQNSQTQIIWDKYGVPHVFAKNTAEMYYAFGWAQMHNHADLILKLYAQGRGNASEFWGEQFIESDKTVRLFNISEKAAIAYKEQHSEYRTYLDYFVKGINDYGKAHPESINEISRKVLPVTPEDVLSHTLRVTCLEFLAAEDINAAGKSADAGSNAIAIAPSKSASKNAMLIINPHLPWSDYFLWFEAHLSTAGFNAYGISLIGTPSITMAFNNTHGWAHTVNPIDGSDRYELSLKKDGYLLDGKIEKFEKKNVELKVLQKDGSLKTLNYEFKYSKQGPVVSSNDKHAYVVRIAGLDNAHIFEQYHKMAKAENFKEFEDAVRMLQNPMFNIIYADREGNIFYLFNGNIPVRNKGDFYFWKGTIDGTKSEYIWEKTHKYEDLPKVLNPSTGFIQNCNDAPWSCTYPSVLNPEDYPAYISNRGVPLRPQRAINMIKDNPSVSYDQLLGYKLNTGMEAADRFLDDLLLAVEQFPDAEAVKAAEVLKGWDKCTNNDSRGAVLFTAWWDKVRSNMFEIPWNFNEPVTTPDGLKDKKLAVELLVKAAQEVEQKYGRIDIAWGEVNRFRMNGLDFPGNGGAGDYGIFRTVYFTNYSSDRKFAIAGETFVAVTEFGEKVKANVLLSYGNATQPGNKHIGDQLEMLSEKKLRPALMEKDEILKNSEEKENLDIH